MLRAPTGNQVETVLMSNLLTAHPFVWSRLQPIRSCSKWRLKIDVVV